ncbi:MAG: TonB family protein [Elusimicrobiota bacterium]
MTDIKFSFVVSVSLHFLFFLCISFFAKPTSSKIYYIPIQVIGGSIGGGGGVGGGDIGGTGEGGAGDTISAEKIVQPAETKKSADVVKSGDIVASKVMTKTTKLNKKDILKWEKPTGKGTGGKGTGSGSGTGTGSGFGSGIGGGVGGGLGVDVGNFPYIGYVNILRNKVAQNWNPAPYTSAGVKKVLVYFRILKNGKIENLTIKESAGVSYIDRSAIRAITNSSPFPPLPVGFPDSSLGVYFMFELSGS